MPVDESWIERYLSREFGKYQDPGNPWRVEDQDLLGIVQSKIREALRGMNAIPESDRFWAGTNREPTVGKLEDYCRRLRSLDQEDESARWYLFALDFH